jgi:uncharacterized damage-inducible protein DinB
LVAIEVASPFTGRGSFDSNPKRCSMLNQQALGGMWDQIRQRHGIALRVIEAIPADKIHSHPIPNMRTPAELVVHLYGMVVREIAEGTLRGQVRELDDAALCAGIKTKDDLLQFARDSYAAAAKAIPSITDAHLQAMVKTPWGMDFPGWMMLGITHDEFLHHRGQLYAYVRALGAEPPMMWDFEHNAPEFQPKEMQKA